MVSSTLSGNSTTYGYDGEGRRVQKTTGGAVTTFVYDAQGQLAEEFSAAAPPVTGKGGKGTSWCVPPHFCIRLSRTRLCGFAGMCR